MSRKSYSEQEREQIRDKLLIAMLQCIAERGLIHSSIDVLCGKAGISKTFFYRFFASKEELVLQALRYQQPKLLSYAQSLMDNRDLSWREGVKTFLTNCCYGAKNGVAVLSLEEEQQIRGCLSEENFHRAIPHAMPFLFPEVAEEMVEFQVNALLDAMERAKEDARQGKADG